MSTTVRIAVALLVVTLGPALVCRASAQELPPLTPAVLAQVVPQSPAPDPAALATPPVALPDRHGPSSVMQTLYATTVVVQGLDAQSTFLALDAGGVETNVLLAPLVKHRAAFIGLKAAVAASIIYGGHSMSRHHKAAAILTLIAVNTVYSALVAHNYRVASRLRNQN